MTDQHQLSLTFLSGDPNEAWDIGCWECIWYAFGYAAQSNITARAQSDHVTITFQDDHVRTWQDTQHVLVLASLQSSPNTLVEGHSIVSCCRQQNFANESHKEAGRGQLVDMTYLSMHLGSKTVWTHMYRTIQPDIP